jgi:hypothetical protein
MAMSMRLREAKALLSANKVTEANSLIETILCSLLNAGKLRQAARANLVFLGRLAARTPQYRSERSMPTVVRAISGSPACV